MISDKFIILEKFRARHINKDYIGWLNNKKLLQYSDRRHTKHNKRNCLLYLKEIQKNKCFFFGIFVKEKKKKRMVGTISAISDYKNNTCDVGILIGEQGKGYGSIAWKKLIKFLFKMKFRKITAGAMKNNIAMIKIFKSSGMKLEYIKKKQYLYKKNKAVDFIGYSIFKK